MIFTTPCEEMLYPFPQLKESKLGEIKYLAQGTEQVDELKFDPRTLVTVLVSLSRPG